MEIINYLFKDLYSMSTEETGLWNLLMYMALLIGALYYIIVLLRNILLRKVILKKIYYKSYDLDYEYRRQKNIPEIAYEIRKGFKYLNFTNHSLGKITNQIIVSFIGYAFIFFGVIFLKMNINLFDFVGIFILIIGYQVFLWSIGVQSEFLGNKPNIEIKKKAGYNNA